MARRYEIDDAQWEKIKPFLGNTPKKTGRPHALRKARLQIPRFHSFGGYTALACIISPADDFGTTP